MCGGWGEGGRQKRLGVNATELVFIEKESAALLVFAVLKRGLPFDAREAIGTLLLQKWHVRSGSLGPPSPRSAPGWP